MNQPIRRLALFSLALFGVLLLNITWIQAIQAESLREHPLNNRQYVDRLTVPRGPIVAGNEQVAFSELDEESEMYQRVYEGGELYSHVVGTFRTTGANGIEQTENSFLDGSDSRLVVRNFLDMLTGQESQGATVNLTIDPAAQQAAMDALQATGKHGAAVALDPSTGAVLASVSLPSFDPNSVSSVTDSGTAAANWGELEQDEAQPLLNRAFNQTYPPGSTFKIVTAAAALEDGATPESTQDAPEVLNLPAGGTMPNAFGAPCNNGSPDSLAHSIEISCNTSMANWAISLGEQKMAEQAEAFGFDTGEMGIPVPVAPSSYPSGLDDSQLGQTGIGQFDVRATPLQMAMVAAGVANDGTVMKPYLVDSVQGPDLSEITSANPEVYSEAVSSSTAEDLKDMMLLVTEGAEGSGTNGAIPGIQVAGKTGTAENGSGATHNWFISFAPADDPQVAVAVVIEHGGGSGNELAAPVARSIMEAVINE
ncbi:peptidoglycan D,D-transpeptidase FtsI family protein [Marinitenerispora sediminis]|uniref:Peptidoglycan glycosyltransferase n=1 Tax=Marinitenerispora sediminis TaxID=1931232 RepID=A0A368T2V5_9ACTN|nr:penicillin-binding protein 2 [Marinitenerispora sediminis]RCV50949.1 peptidoglycan glycosyltransferase [Marinitenerispora sediminis]RCV56348.1 peptidoglycan glycosyltransferase [Marinitenerispora sediminis]RCV60412.1 peptidoglycan glycosyltransferase [Marinitenerispora sediminis]